MINGCGRKYAQLTVKNNVDDVIAAAEFVC